MKKRGQLKLSFGMMFSIFLIIIFLAFAFYAIMKFIDLQQTVQIETFKEILQSDINTMWQSQQGSRSVEYGLPKKIDAVCFTDDDYQNVLFMSEEILAGADISNIDMDYIDSQGDSYCFGNVEGKVNMTLVKEYGESLVKVTKQN